MCFMFKMNINRSFRAYQVKRDMKGFLIFFFYIFIYLKQNKKIKITREFFTNKKKSSALVHIYIFICSLISLFGSVFCGQNLFRQHFIQCCNDVLWLTLTVILLLMFCLRTEHLATCKLILSRLLYRSSGCKLSQSYSNHYYWQTIVSIRTNQIEEFHSMNVLIGYRFSIKFEWLTAYELWRMALYILVCVGIFDHRSKLIRAEQSE